MRLRTTEERDTLVYATSPINFGGVEREDLVMWVIPLVIANKVTDDPLISFAIGCACLWFYKKATRNQPSGHLVLHASLLIGRWEQSELAAKVPAIKKPLTKLNKMLSKLWIDAGLLPSPTYCNRYEP
jgi:hypothetical protein